MLMAKMIIKITIMVKMMMITTNPLTTSNLKIDKYSWKLRILIRTIDRAS